MAATAQVLSSAQLVEQILHQGLSAAEIISARRIDLFIKNTIENSPSLRRKIFLDPEPASSALRYTSQTASNDSNSSERFDIIKLHPALGIQTVSKTGRFYITTGTANQFQESFSRSMLICQPPCNVFFVGDFIILGRTLGHLIDAIKKHQAQGRDEPKTMFEIAGSVAEERSFLGQKAKAMAIKLKREADEAKTKELAVEAIAEVAKTASFPGARVAVAEAAASGPIAEKSAAEKKAIQQIATKIASVKAAATKRASEEAMSTAAKTAAIKKAAARADLEKVAEQAKFAQEAIKLATIQRAKAQHVAIKLAATQKAAAQQAAIKEAAKQAKKYARKQNADAKKAAAKVQKVARKKAATAQQAVAKARARKIMRKEDHAAARVFNITELFEQIFQNVSPAEITRARQINSEFKKRIDQSLPLRRAMFLEPEPRGETLPYPTFDEEDDDADWPAPDDTSETSAVPDKSPKTFTVFKVHPAISAPIQPADGYIHFKLPEKPWKAGMWQEMLLCQPPCQNFELRYHIRCRSMSEGVFDGWINKSINGNTLGALVKAIDDHKMRSVVKMQLDPIVDDYVEDGTIFIEKARDWVLAGKIADQMVALCKARNEGADDGASDGKQGQPSEPNEQHVKTNKFGKLCM